MKNFLFKRTILYNSKYTLDEIRSRLEVLINGKQKVDAQFFGEIKSQAFSLTPILGPRQNFKVLILGRVEDKHDNRAVEVIFTLRPTLRYVVYGVLILFPIAFMTLKITDTTFKFNDLKQGENLFIILPSVFLIVSLIIFRYQVDTYSKLLKNLLELE
jgi:hypothetical protein